MIIQKNNFKNNIFILYTVMFCFIVAGIFLVFAINGSSFIQYGDGLRQTVFRTLDIKNIFSSIISGNGIPQWSWSKGLGSQCIYRLDPFNLVAAAFPLKYIELGISISLILKLYFGGLSFIYFAKEMNMSKFKCVAGSICYTFSTWFLCVMVHQSSFLFAIYMIPLLILSIDWICRGKSPVLFILCVAYILIRDTYMAYIIAIGAIVFMLLRYFAYNDKFSIKGYFSHIGKFVCYGLIGGLLSAMFSLQYVLLVSGASTESTHSNYGLFWGIGFVQSLGKMFLSVGYSRSYSFIGLPILALLVLPLAFKKNPIKNTNVLMTIILLLLTMSPLACSMFNGFSYPSARWFVLLVFFASWSAMECMDIKKLGKRENVILLSAWLGAIVLWTIGFEALGLITLTLRGKAFILLNLAAAAALIFAIAGLKNKGFTTKHRQIAVLFITSVTLICCWSMNFYLFQNKFMSIGETNQLLSQSVQRVSTAIQDDDFYRSDQVDWINLHHKVDMPANENLWWQSKSIYTYDSLISTRQLELNKLTGNNYGYVARVYTLSNDNRMGLDFLYGVKYFFGNDLKNGSIGSDEYAGYGFSLDNNIDGVNIFKNKYDPDLGFAYYKYMSESEFLKLDKFQREQSLLQAAVIPDNEGSQISPNIKRVKAKEIDTDIKRLNYSIVAKDGIEVEDNKLLVEKDDASLTIKANNTGNSQLIIAFNNLVNSNGDNFGIECNNGKIIEYARKSSSNQSLPEISDYSLNMGYYSENNASITIRFTTEGEYTFDSIELVAMNVDNYDKYANERIAEKFNITDYSSNYVKGYVDAKADGILYFSIPQYTNWDVYIDNQKVEKITDVNIAFLGAEISEGHHQVALKYHNSSMKYGAFASILGLLLLLLLFWWHRRHLNK